MRDKRPVDELSIEELERILAIRKREEREKKLERMKRSGRVVASEPIQVPPSVPEIRLPLENAVPIAAGDGFKSSPAKAESLSQGGLSPRFDDDPAPTDYRAGKSEDKDRFWRSFVNQSLLLIEVMAIAGLVFLGYQMFSSISKLEQETANAQSLADEQRRVSMPTLEPTPQIQLAQVVLPGGHTFTASGAPRFNYEEIPANLLPLVESQILQPVISRPPQTEESALQLTIPKINVDQTIVPGVDWEALKLGIGQLINGVNPSDERGNLVLSGHNDIYGEVFRDLDQLAVGDEFFVRTRTKVFRYRVTGTDIVDPTEISVMDFRGGATATLISCYPYKVNNKRYIVFAERVGNV